ncbi:solute carrier family 23 protein [Legionella bononiensis]|uniref:Purine/pyrimidine permease n=1 Tax=Legionella bononiensis TaxID=2793102 RepID=A0ABS1WAK6_9GAMM|nr:solute carrier family 23 protein [Legionella bononiensis]MBL7480374.1 purine/pyrimidine permease [Legionella bononiensis]MBL7526394.1 purine/pyrimidine permease [Legionella bononiensis]MBL7563112.1 purine/pyrimidine permease [Legionella bononiensis]
MPITSRTVIYNTADKPPFLTQLLLGVQLLVKFSIMAMFPLMVAKYAGASPDATATLISMSLIWGAIATLIQAIALPKISSGALLPSFTSIPYFVASLSAAHLGGLSMVFGMSLIGGLVQLILTPLIRSYRFVFTKDTAAFILVMLGFWLGVLGVQELFSPSELGQLMIHNTSSIPQASTEYKHGIDIIGFNVLALMVIIRLWSPQKLRLYCILIGILTGWILAYLNGFIPDTLLQRVESAPWLQLPHLMMPHYSFSKDLLFPFLIASFITTFAFFALACVNQRVASNDWKEPDLSTIRRGNLWLSITTILASGTGSIAQSPLPGAVGLSITSGAYSKIIAYTFSMLLILISFSPKVVAVFLTIPAGVNGATAVIIGASLFMFGINMWSLQNADSKKTYAIGIAFLIAASSDIIPAIYNPFPEIGIVTTEPALLLGLICFIVLTVLFSIKLFKRHTS